MHRPISIDHSLKRLNYPGSSLRTTRWANPGWLVASALPATQQAAGGDRHRNFYGNRDNLPAWAIVESRQTGGSFTYRRTILTSLLLAAPT